MSRGIVCLLLISLAYASNAQPITDRYGALVRSDTTSPPIYLCFTGHDFYEGFDHVLEVLESYDIEASFFLTGDFVRNHPELITSMARQGHFIGAHSDKHLLYCDWSERDSLLHSPEAIRTDIQANLFALAQLGIRPQYFMPPYEWYNHAIVVLAKELGQTLVTFSQGTRSNADYTTPDMPTYVPSKTILESIYQYEAEKGMNGFHLLIHPGTDPKRTDKLYLHLEELILSFQGKGYTFQRFGVK